MLQAKVTIGSMRNEYRALELSTKLSKANAVEEQNYILHAARWKNLILFGILSALNSAIWISFSSITRIVCDHYKISVTWVNALSMVFLVTYVPLVFPAS